MIVATTHILVVFIAQISVVATAWIWPTTTAQIRHVAAALIGPTTALIRPVVIALIRLAATIQI